MPCGSFARGLAEPIDVFPVRCPATLEEPFELLVVDFRLSL